MNSTIFKRIGSKIFALQNLATEIVTKIKLNIIFKQISHLHYLSFKNSKTKIEFSTQPPSQKTNNITNLTIFKCLIQPFKINPI